MGEAKRKASRPPSEAIALDTFGGRIHVEWDPAAAVTPLVITKVDASSSAIRLGSDQVRDVTTEGDLMVLRPPKRIHSERVEQRTLYWEKISEV